MEKKIHLSNNPTSTYQYAIFREDIPQKPGYSKELICIANKNHPDQVVTPVYNGFTTIWEGFENTVKRFGNRQFLGTRNKNKQGGPYEWKTF